jgi:hypothetical protein
MRPSFPCWHQSSRPRTVALLRAVETDMVPHHSRNMDRKLGEFRRHRPWLVTSERAPPPKPDSSLGGITGSSSTRDQARPRGHRGHSKAGYASVWLTAESLHWTGGNPSAAARWDKGDLWSARHGRHEPVCERGDPRCVRSLALPRLLNQTEVACRGDRFPLFSNSCKRFVHSLLGGDAVAI